MSTPIQLIATDVDGTLLDEQGDLPEVNAVALRKAYERGVRLALASIRKHDSASHVAGLIGVPCFLVTQGGARIYDESGALLRESLIPLQLAHAIASFADLYELPMMATIDEINYYRPGSHPNIDMRYIAGRDVDLLADAIVAPPSRLIIRGQHGLDLLMDTLPLAQLGIRTVRHFLPDGTLYDAVFTHATVTKEAALQIVCQTAGISPAAMLALGDAESDIGMLRLAGVGVAVANAQADVLAAADWVAPAAPRGGVAAAIERFVLNISVE